MSKWDNLLEKTGERKRQMIERYNSDSKYRFFVDLDRNGAAKMLYLPFLDELTDNIEEILAGLPYEDRYMPTDIYQAWYNDKLTYEDLPEEAQLFEC